MKTKLCMIVLAFFSFQVMAQNIELLEGSYHGAIDTSQAFGKKPVQLILQNYPGRTGSFLAILIRDKKVGFAYLVDKFQKNKFGMIPLRALKNGTIGVENSNPSLSLNVVYEGKNPFIKILPNNSDNQLGFQEAMRIKLENRNYKTVLMANIPGTYRNGSSNSNTVTNQDTNREASVSLNTKDLQGEYILREVRNSLHLLLKSSMTGAGMSTQDESKYMAFFLSERCLPLIWEDSLVIMSSETGELTYLARKW